jgi:lysozyme
LRRKWVLEDCELSRIKKGGALAGIAVAVVGGYEGLRLVAYRDVVGTPTACFGETRGIRMGQKFTKAECDAMLLKGLDEFGDGIEKCVPSLRSVPEKRYVAHLSLAYNIGVGGYCKSSIARLQKAGDDLAACDRFLLYNKAGGRELAGLTKRRQNERAMCRLAGPGTPPPDPVPPPAPDPGENPGVPADWSFLPWLLGMLVLVGGLFFFIRRKKKG